MTRASDITSFTEFRSRLRDHLDERKTTTRPLFVTSNGQTDAVVLSPEAYDELVEDAELARSVKVLRQSEEDIKAGRTRPALQAIRDLATKLGVNLDR